MKKKTNKNFRHKKKNCFKKAILWTSPLIIALLEIAKAILEMANTLM